MQWKDWSWRKSRKKENRGEERRETGRKEKTRQTETKDTRPFAVTVAVFGGGGGQWVAMKTKEQVMAEHALSATCMCSCSCTDFPALCVWFVPVARLKLVRLPLSMSCRACLSDACDGTLLDSVHSLSSLHSLFSH
jgi:hypothetical protein